MMDNGKVNQPSTGAQAWTIIAVLGLASLPAYLYAWRLGDLRENTIAFLGAFFTAFVLYAIATAWALMTSAQLNSSLLIIIFGFAILFSLLLVNTPPTLSDDMYRYVWDGRVQAEGISPYRFPPSAAELAHLRDWEGWRSINRKQALTVYPPAAELVYALLWRLRPDNVRWFQIVTAVMALLAGGLLVGLLRDLGRSTSRVLIYLWSPLLLFETAHAAHVDGLMLPLLVGALWARQRGRDGLVGFLLGIATAMKFIPALLLPALWRPNHPRGRWQMPLGFGIALLASYLPYLVQSGTQVFGFLPGYVRERFNVAPPLLWYMRNNPFDSFSEAQRVLLLVTLGLLGFVSLYMVLRPAEGSEAAIRRCLWPIAILTLLNPNMFSWYLLWLLPLLAIFMQPGRIRWRGRLIPAGLRLDAWTGWWLFTGLVALSYTFFLNWKTIPGAVRAQYIPLYIFLGIELLRRVLPKDQPMGFLARWRPAKPERTPEGKHLPERQSQPRIEQ